MKFTCWERNGYPNQCSWHFLCPHVLKIDESDNLPWLIQVYGTELPRQRQANKMPHIESSLPHFLSVDLLPSISRSLILEPNGREGSVMISVDSSQYTEEVAFLLRLVMAEQWTFLWHDWTFNHRRGYFWIRFERWRLEEISTRGCYYCTVQCHAPAALLVSLQDQILILELLVVK